MDYTERDLLTNAEKQAAWRAAGFLSDRPSKSTVEKVLFQLSDPDLASQNQTKCWLLDRLLHASGVGKGDKSSLFACVSLLNSDTDSAVKQKAMEVLSVITPTTRIFEGRSELMSALGKMATDWNVRIREMAVQLLLEVADRRDKDTLASIVCSVGNPATGDPPQYLRLASLEALSAVVRRGDPAARDALRGDLRTRGAVFSGLFSHDDAVRRRSVEVLRGLAVRDDSQVLEKVLHLLRDREEDVRLATLDLLRDVASRGNRRAVACLCDFLAAEPDGSGPRVRPRAVATLVGVARRGDTEALRALVVALDDPDPALRAAAAVGVAGLAIQGEPIPVFALLLRLNRHKVRRLLLMRPFNRPLRASPHGHGHGASGASAASEGDLPRLIVGRFLGDRPDGGPNDDAPSPRAAAAAAAAAEEEQQRAAMAEVASYLFREDAAELHQDPRIAQDPDPLCPAPAAAASSGQAATAGAAGRSGGRGKLWLPPAALVVGADAGAAAGLATVRFGDPSQWGARLGQRRCKVWSADSDAEAARGRWRARPALIRPAGRAKGLKMGSTQDLEPPPPPPVITGQEGGQVSDDSPGISALARLRTAALGLVKQGRLATPSIVSASRHLMAHSTSRFRTTAATTHHGSTQPSAQPNTDEDAAVREAVLVALRSVACHGDIAVAEVVMERLGDSEDRVRCAALETLAYLLVPIPTKQRGSGIKQMTVLGADEDDRMWEELSNALHAQLLRLLEDRDGQVRITALGLLQEIGELDDMSAITKVAACAQIGLLPAAASAAALVRLSRGEQGNKTVIRCILDCISRERKVKRDSPEFRLLVESLRQSTIKGDRQTIVGLSDILKNSNTGGDRRDKRDEYRRILHRFSGRNDQALIDHLVSFGSSEVQPHPELLVEIEGHRAALLLGDLRLPPSTPLLVPRLKS